MPLFDLQQARAKYLEMILTRYATITLPLASARFALSLQSVFQSMILHRDPLAPPQIDCEGEQVQERNKARDGSDALRKSEFGRMVVLGGPGMGKTTALKALLAQAVLKAQHDLLAPLPLFISLPDLMRANLSFEEYIRQILIELELDLEFTSVLTEAIQSGQAFLCLDSLDEVLPTWRSDVITFLNVKAPHYGGTWIIGSRFTEYKGGQFSHSQFTEWELQALNEKERTELASQLLPLLHKALYHEASPKPTLPSAKGFIEELQKNLHQAAWVENPLLLSLAAMLYIQKDYIPTSRAALYAQVTDAMLSMRLPEAKQRLELRDLLAEMALEFYQTRGRNFHISDLLEFLPTILPDQNTSALYTTLAQILDSGVLEPMAFETYGFKHQMFQEYLAAVALAHRSIKQAGGRQSIWNLLWRKRRMSRWNEILRMWVGILVQNHGTEGLQLAKEWLTALAQEDTTEESDPGNLCLILAMRSLGECGEWALEPDVETLAKQIFQIWAEKYSTLFNLGGWRYAEFVKVEIAVFYPFSLQIMAPIMQQNQYVREHYTIPTSSHSINLPIHLLWHLFQNRYLSFYACHSKSVLQTPEVIKKLITIIKEAQGKWSLEDKVAAAKALGAKGEFTPVPFLTAIWQNQELDAELRTSAAKAIKDSETPISFEMIEAFLRDPNTAIRRVGIEILDKHDNQTHINLLLYALQDSDPYIRRHALIRAKESGSTIPIDILQPLLYDKDEKVSYYAWFYLQASSENVPFERWLEALQHENAVIHNLTLKIIEHHKDQFPVEPILAILSHHTNTQHEMRLSCIKALELLGERVPPEPLLKLLEDPNKHIQSQALTVLAKRNIRISADSLLSMLDDVTTGKAAAENLASMGSEAPIKAILEIARSHHAEGPNYAFYALRLLANYVPTKAILPFLQQEKIFDYYHGDYWELVQLLQAQGIEIPFEQLRFVLHEKSYDMTITTPIVASLARAGAKAPIELLLRLTYESAHKNGSAPDWIQQLFYVLYEWITPVHLTNALNNTPDDQSLAILMLGKVNDEESIQLITAIAQDTSRDRDTRSTAIFVLNSLAIDLPLDFLIQATRWSSYIGMESDFAETVERLGKQAPVEKLLHLLGQPRSQASKAALKALIHIVEHLSLEMILPLLQDKNELVQQAAIRILGAMRERAPLEVFVKLLKDPEQSQDIHEAVVRALGEMSTPAAVDLLLAALEHENPKIRHQAIWSLQDSDDPDNRGGLRAVKEYGKEIPLEPILKMIEDSRKLLDDSSDKLPLQESIAVLGQLAELGVSVPTEPLIALLEHEDTYLIRQAAEALCKFGERTPVKTLLEHLYDSENGQVNEEIFSALASSKMQIPLKALLEAIPKIEKSIFDDYHLRYACNNLARSMPEQVLELLHDKIPPVSRYMTLLAIKQAPSVKWLPLVLDTLQRPNDQYLAFDRKMYGNKDTIRTAAIEALGALNASAPIEPLIQLLHTNTEELSYHDQRIVVLKALRKFGDRLPMAELWPLLGSNNSEVSSLAFEHLQEFYPGTMQELTPLLKAILRGETVQGPFAPRMQYRLAGVVGTIKRANPTILNLVIELLDNPFWEIRAQAAKTLGILRRNIPNQAIQRLFALRHDPESPNVRLAADQALAAILSLEQGMEDE